VSFATITLCVASQRVFVVVDFFINSVRKLLDTLSYICSRYSARLLCAHKLHSRVLERGSRGPSTVTLIALLYVATCGGDVLTVMVMLKLFPATETHGSV
jgi:hypothetical protein